MRRCRHHHQPLMKALFHRMDRISSISSTSSASSSGRVWLKAVVHNDAFIFRSSSTSSSPKSSMSSTASFPFSSPVQSKHYASVLERTIFQPWSRKFIDSVPMPLSGEKVLDVASGTGATSREIAAILGNEDRFSQVVGIDSSEGMVEEAKRREDIFAKKRAKNEKTREDLDLSLIHI